MFETKEINTSDLNIGDTVLIDGKMVTIGKESVKTGYCGTMVNGFRASKVQQVLFAKWYKGKVVGYFPQI